MRTALKIGGISAVFFGLTLFSCKSESLDTEMQLWCTCEQQAKTNASKKGECTEMMKDITRKYEFDPEAVVKIQTKILECKQ